MRRIFFLLLALVTLFLLVGCSDSVQKDLVWQDTYLISTEDSVAAITPLIMEPIVIEGSYIHVAWSSSASREKSDIYYKQSADLGETWTKPKKITDAQGKTGGYTVEVEGRNVYLVWKDVVDSPNGTLYFSKSEDNGETWNEKIEISKDVPRSSAPTIAVKEAKIFVSWENYNLGTSSNVEFRKSSDYGETWEESKSLTPDLEGCPDLKVDDKGNLNLIYCSNNYDKRDSKSYNWEIMYMFSNDNGETWEGKERLTNDDAGDSRFPLVEIASTGTIHTVWWDDRDDTNYLHEGYPPQQVEDDHNYEIYYKRFNGGEWEEDIRLTTAEGIGANPSLATFGENLFIVWDDNRQGNEEIYLKYSLDDGLTWSDDIRVTNDESISQWASIATDDEGNFYIIWTDRTTGSYEVYLKKGELV